MTGSFGPAGPGRSSFDDFLAQFFGAGPMGRRAYPVDITSLMSDQARDLVSDAVRQTGGWGRADVDTEQLLWAATRQTSTRVLLERAGAGADPDEPAGRIERQSEVGEPRTRDRGARPSAAAKSTTAKSTTATLEQFGNDLTEPARSGGLDPVIGRDEEIEQTVEVLSRRTKNNPVLIGEAGVSARPRSWKAWRCASPPATCPTTWPAAAWSSWTWPRWWRARATAVTSRSA